MDASDVPCFSLGNDHFLIFLWRKYLEKPIPIPKTPQIYRSLPFNPSSFLGIYSAFWIVKSIFMPKKKFKNAHFKRQKRQSNIQIEFRHCWCHKMHISNIQIAQLILACRRAGKDRYAFERPATKNTRNCYFCAEEFHQHVLNSP